MTQEEIIKQFTNLSEGKLTGPEWLSWFNDYTDDIEKLCGRRAFLAVKPKESLSDIRNLYIGQLGAFEWLQSKKVETYLSDLYKKGWEQEFEEFCRQEKQKEKELQKTVEEKFGYLKTVYPKFFKQLTRSYSNSDHIEKGVEGETIKKKEQDLSITFSDEIIIFYQSISKLQMEGIAIDFAELSTETIQNKNYLFMGEFWLHGDGDHVLYNTENQNVYVLAHENNPPKMIKISNSLHDLVEKKIVTYLKENE
ncbi:hypothetical protein [Chryseobacterium sp. Mn2064]|uniref:hypothetical protein n=1 Tax=Chryseobacterium sp. Mn2064 TaxID=3395263 RepID=UPI003BCF5821